MKIRGKSILEFITDQKPLVKRALTNAINILADCITRLEQILFIPMPKAFDTLMKQILMLYFFALPMQIVKSLGWFVVPVVAITSFAIFGVETIVSEIAEPFGVRFCSFAENS